MVADSLASAQEPAGSSEGVGGQTKGRCSDYGEGSITDEDDELTRLQLPVFFLCLDLLFFSVVQQRSVPAYQ